MLYAMLRAFYRRNPFLDAVPWLMLASAMRFAAFSASGPGKLVALCLSDLAVFLAFLLAARRMIEWTGGSVRFGQLPLRDQVLLGRRILGRVLLLLVAVAVAAALLGFKSAAPHLLKGFDGIAFDQFTTAGRIWSAVLAAIVYLMLIDADRDGAPSLLRAARDGMRHWRWVLPAIVAIALAHIVLTFVQGQARYLVVLGWRTLEASSDAPQSSSWLMHYVYFAFVFTFAAIRLWITLAILTFALREAYRRNQADTARLISSPSRPPP